MENVPGQRAVVDLVQGFVPRLVCEIFNRKARKGLRKEVNQLNSWNPLNPLNQLLVPRLPSLVYRSSSLANHPFGNRMVNVVPLPSSEFLTKILPEWYSSIILLARESPRPQPLLLVV